MYVPGRDPPGSWIYGSRAEGYKIKMPGFLKKAFNVVKMIPGVGTAISAGEKLIKGDLAGAMSAGMSLTPMGRMGALAGMASSAMGSMGSAVGGAVQSAGGLGGIAEDAALLGAGALGARALMGGGGGGGMGAPGGGMMYGAPGAPGGSGGPGGGSYSPISISPAPIKINIQLSGKDMAASSGVFEEDIGGPPGMTNNTMAAPGAEEVEEAEEEDAAPAGGMFGGMFGKKKAAPEDVETADSGKKGKKPKKEKKPKKPAKAAPKLRGRKGRYTEEFSTGGIIPLIEESDVPLITFAIIAILISLN